MQRAGAKGSIKGTQSMEKWILDSGLTIAP